MQNMNPIIVKTDEHMLPNKLSHFNFDILNEIKADELGRTEINHIAEKFKQAMEDEVSSYLNGRDRYCLPFHIGLPILAKIITEPKADHEDAIEDLSDLYTTIILYNLSEYYKNSLLSSARNDHHAYMLLAVQNFTRKFYRDYMVEEIALSIILSTIGEDRMAFLYCWLEFGILKTQDELII